MTDIRWLAFALPLTMACSSGCGSASNRIAYANGAGVLVEQAETSFKRIQIQRLDEQCGEYEGPDEHLCALRVESEIEPLHRAHDIAEEAHRAWVRSLERTGEDGDGGKADAAMRRFLERYDDLRRLAREDGIGLPAIALEGE